MKGTDIRNIDEGIKIIKDRFPTHKALILLDDVEEKDHMDALVGKRDRFGEGSKLIITTRRKDVLHVPEVDWTYELMGMDPHQSLQLFSKHAFRRDSPLDEYINHTKRAIHIAKGLPLTLEVIGSLLFGKNKEMWDATLNVLESVPHDKVQNKLKISYDALDYRQKHIFLDIACHFIGYRKDIVVIFWDASELFSEATLEVLQNMSLIKIEKHNKLWMHDQLRDLGREIVRQESKMKIEKQHCVWSPKEGLDLLKSHKMKKKVEALHVKFDDQHQFTYEDFKNLPNLTFLEVEHLWHTRPLDILSTNVFQKNSNLLPQLRWLSWHNIHPTFEITNFSMQNVIILDLSESKITHDWKGWSHMKVIKNLKVLDLSYCECLKITPDLSARSKLECLILLGCASLIEIDRSICQLKCLVFLDVSYCWKLKRLPDELGGDLTSLKYLFAKNCERLEMLAETIGNLESLTDLDIRGTCIKELPDSIGKMKNLKVVKMYKTSISKIPDAFWMIEKLEEIKVCRYESDGYFQVEIGNCIYRNKSLRILRFRDAIIHAPRKLPESLIVLELEELRVDTFPDLKNLANLKVLRLEFGPPNCDGKSYGLLEKQIPRWIGNLSKLESLELRFFKETASSKDLSLPPHPRRLPRLPSNLSSLHLSYCDSLCSMDLSNLRKLSSLRISFSAVAKIQGLGCLENLRDLDLRHVGQLAVLPDLSKLNKLRRILVSYCDNLVEIQGALPWCLDQLDIHSCSSFLVLPVLFSLMGSKTVIDIDGSRLYAHKSQYRFWLWGFEQMQILPDLSNWNELSDIHVENCDNLVEIQGELPQSLEKLKIEDCKSLQKLPDLSSLKGLRMVVIKRCGKLDVEEISRLCSEKSIKFVGEDDEEDEFVEEYDE